MNRKQRRRLEKRQEKKAEKFHQPTASPQAALLKQQGLALRDAGDQDRAADLLRQAIAIDPGHADAHFALAMMARTKTGPDVDMEQVNRSVKDTKVLLASYGSIMSVLRRKRQYKEAAVCQEEICRLVPEDALALMDLGLLLNITGEYERAALALSKALAMNPEDKVLRGVYATSLHAQAFTAFHPEIKAAILTCFSDIYGADLTRLIKTWPGLMMKDPVFAPLSKALAIDGEEAFRAWADGLDESTGAFLSDPYLTGGLRNLIIIDALLERTLTRLRRYICLNFSALGANGRIALFEKFLYALAEQCFFNEYVYASSEDEESAVDALSGSDDKRTIALTACYRPLCRSMPDRGKLLHELAKNDSEFARLVKTQFDDPAEEEKIKLSLPAFGNFANEISRAVRSQYEENPYPRWISVCTTPLPNADSVLSEESRGMPFKILIAGCGTGRHAIVSAILNRNAKITAIDLSRASLAYGQRKARECGTAGDRINFVHADILSMAGWPDTFDIIESSGVLHHMEDPFEGWRILTGKLKPNGLMKIGLYSESGRKAMIAGREFVTQGGFSSTPEGIRACRQAVFSLPANDPMREGLVHSGDFYTMSLARDLIFHVQEHRFTLPEIADMLERLGLTCIKFIINDPLTISRYDSMFPDDTRRCSLDNWQKFEKKFPNAFSGMYQFWAQKSAISSPASP